MASRHSGSLADQLAGSTSLNCTFTIKHSLKRLSNKIIDIVNSIATNKPTFFRSENRDLHFTEVCYSYQQQKGVINKKELSTTQNAEGTNNLHYFLFSQ
jgi:hypothetical protein